MNNCKFVSSPLDLHFKLSFSLCPQTKEKMCTPPANVDNLMYAIVFTRPDLVCVVSMVSLYMHDPGEKHWNVVKRQGSRVGLL